MNPYLKEHLKRLFLLKYKEFLIYFFLSALVIFLFYINNDSAYIIGMLNCFIFILFCTQRKFINIRSPNEYRYNEMYLLPFNELELFQYNFFRRLILFGPSIFIFGSTAIGVFVLDEKDYNMLKVISIIACGICLLFYYILLQVKVDLSVLFKKQETFKKVISFVRNFSKVIIWGGLFSVAIHADHVNKYQIPILLLSFILVSFGLSSFYIFHKRKEYFFNEHSIFNRNKFRMIVDIPAFLVTASAVGLIIFGLSLPNTPHKVRTPASVKTLPTNHN